MKKNILVSLFADYERKQWIIGETECWQGRKLMELLGYNSFNDFLKLVNRAQQFCKDLGVDPSKHFFPIRNRILKLNVKYKKDLVLSGFACFCISESLPFSSDAIVVAKAYFYSFREQSDTNFFTIQKYVDKLENQHLKFYLYS